MRSKLVVSLFRPSDGSYRFIQNSLFALEGCEIMNLCDNGCGCTLGQRENPTYEVRVVELHAVSRVYHFCSVGCASDWLTLSSQGLQPVEFIGKG